MAMTEVGIVVGNPKPISRTRQVAEVVAGAVASVVGCSEAERFVIELADLGPRLFDWSSPVVRDAVDRLAACRLAVVASPTYKASYTGLLKSFLDWFSTTGLSGVAVVPVMVGAGSHHALAVEVHLRPVLVEIGATVPTRGLYVTEERLADLDEVIATWLVEAGPLLQGATGATPG
jgi:FMN reductase